MIRARAVAALIVILAVGTVTRAEKNSAGTPEEKLAQGLQAFARGDWAGAIATISRVAPRLKSLHDRAIAYKTMGLAEVERKRIAEAELNFVQALTANPLIDVDPKEDPPPAVALFRSVAGRLDGRLVVSVDRTPARVAVDGVDHGEVPFEGRVKIGRHRIRVTTPDGHFAAESGDVVVRVAGDTRIALTLAPLVGFLTVTGPKGYTVALDGTTIGTTPLVKAGVKPGRHVVIVSREGHESKDLALDFAVGEERTMDGTLRKAAAVGSLGAASIEWTTPPRRTRPWAFATLGTAVATIVVGAVLFFNPPAISNASYETYNSDAEKHNNSIRWGAGLMIAGGTLGAATVALFALHRDGKRATTTGIPSVSFGPRGEWTLTWRR